MDDTVNNLFKLGLIAGAAYVAYLAYQSLKAPAAAVNTAYQSATQAIANLFPGTSPTVIPNGNVQMPNGAIIPVAAWTNLGFDSNGILVFSYGGTYYAITGATGSPGAYVATPYGSTTLQGLSRPRRRGLR
jgi:hypothetical protein